MAGAFRMGSLCIVAMAAVAVIVGCSGKDDSKRVDPGQDTATASSDAGVVDASVVELNPSTLDASASDSGDVPVDASHDAGLVEEAGVLDASPDGSVDAAGIDAVPDGGPTSGNDASIDGGSAVTVLDASIDPCSKIPPSTECTIYTCGDAGISTITLPDGAACIGGLCISGLCRAPSCSDKLRDGTETDVDCGGTPCAACLDGRTCLTASDCLSVSCKNGICAKPVCNDGVRNGVESDMDCGGACSRCKEGAHCDVADDCMSGVCAGHVCMAPTCTDAVRNQDEHAPDCGGSCPPCPSGAPCESNVECVSLVCSDGLCAVATCSDGVTNGGEPAMDCGAACSPCAEGLPCKAHSDCQTRRCQTGYCTAAACDDRLADGDETDVDCGGTCGPCKLGFGCVDKSDCADGECFHGRCATAFLDFQSARTFAPGNYGLHGASADFDGDGDLDVVLVAPTADAFTLLRNDGRGNFTDGGSFSTGAIPRYVAVSDLNRDGRLDVVVSSWGTNTNHTDATVNIHLNDANGGFFRAQTLSLTQAAFPAVGDTNGDGAPEVVVVPERDLYGASVIQVFSNDGKGVLSLGQSIAASKVYAAVLLDADQDGDLDVVAAISNTGIRTFFNSAGVFGSASGTGFADGSPAVNYLSVGDLNGDGFPDLYLAADAFGVSCVLLNDQKGKFSNCEVSTEPEIVHASGPAILADIDANGTLDVLVPSNELINPEQSIQCAGGGIHVLKNSGNGVLVGSHLWTGENPKWLVAGDLDGDCQTDIGYGTTHALRTLSKQTDNSFHQKLEGGGWTKDHLVVVDLNTDGLPDLVGANEASLGAGRLNIAINQTGRLDAVSSFSYEAIRGAPSYPVAADVNADGRIDIVAVSTNNDAVDVLLGGGGKVFGTATRVVAACINPRAVVVCDMNDDGRLDLVVACEGILDGAFGAGMSVHLGFGDGTFGGGRFYQSGSLYRAAVERLGKDDSLSAVVIGESAVGIAPIGPTGTVGVISWLHNGVFSNLRVADLDGDEAKDLVLTDGVSATVTVIWNDGFAGGVLAGTVHPTHPRPDDAAIGDLNSDGRPDLAIVQYGTESVRVLYNIGARRFGEARDYEAALSSHVVEIADVDGDGQNDLIVAGGLTRVIHGLRGQAPLDCPVTAK